MPKRRTSKPVSEKPKGPIRLQRILSAAGLGSRRQCEELIEEGRVQVDGETVTVLGTAVDPEAAKIKVDGKLLRAQRPTYYAVNKPTGFVTTNRDPQGRPRVVDLVPPDPRVFPVGRLDRSSEGLIVLTNDGELAQRLAHPRYGIRKVYRVTVAGKVEPETMRTMKRGIHLAEGTVRVDGVKRLKTRSRATDLEIVLSEGKNREIRRILARLGHKVQTLRRIAVGPAKLGDLPAGSYRPLTPNEIEKLHRLTSGDPDSAAPSRSRTAGRDSGPKKKARSSRSASTGRGKPTGAQVKSSSKKPRRAGKPKSGQTHGPTGDDSRIVDGILIAANPNSISDPAVDTTDAGEDRRRKRTAKRRAGSAGGSADSSQRPQRKSTKRAAGRSTGPGGTSKPTKRGKGGPKRGGSSKRGGPSLGGGSKRGGGPKRGSGPKRGGGGPGGKRRGR